jgi:hypothetical protein
VALVAASTSPDVESSRRRAFATLPEQTAAVNIDDGWHLLRENSSNDVSAHDPDFVAVYSAITWAILALASASSRVSASLRPASGLTPLTMHSDERRSGSYVMADREDRSHVGCVMGKRSRTPGGRLMDLRTAAAYLGCSYWTLRDLALNGHVPIVRIPSPRAKDGRTMRRILIDSRDLDMLIERWKEVNNADIVVTGDRHP